MIARPGAAMSNKVAPTAGSGGGDDAEAQLIAAGDAPSAGEAAAPTRKQAVADVTFLQIFTKFVRTQPLALLAFCFGDDPLLGSGRPSLLNLRSLAVMRRPTSCCIDMLTIVAVTREYWIPCLNPACRHAPCFAGASRVDGFRRTSSAYCAVSKGAGLLAPASN